MGDPFLDVHGPSRGLYPHYLVIAAIFKNEALYLPEWIEYHLVVGVDKFFLYDNGSNDGPGSALCPYIRDGVVNLTRWLGRAQQLPVYNFALRELQTQSFWIAFLDIDEFLVPGTESTVSRMLRPFEDAAGLTIYWVVFGSGGQLNKTAGLVIERFTDHVPMNHPWNHLVKSIVNPRFAHHMEAHEAYYEPRLGRFSCDCNGTFFPGWVDWLDRRPVHSCLRINHYWTKSFEEWLGKWARGRAPTNLTRNVNHYREFGKWFGYNDTMIDRYVPNVKRGLALRQPCAFRQ
jgi:hypothetical protein